jgi:outer membrane protein OmpA-like peptidoglycan-associated protein
MSVRRPVSSLPPARRLVSVLGALAIGVATLVSTSLRAQALPQSFPAERLRPSLDRNGIIDVEWGSVPDHLGLNVGAWVWYTHNPLVLYAENPDGSIERVQTLVGSRVAGSGLFSIGLFKRVQLGFELPFVLFQYRPDPDPAKPGAALVGDQLQAVGLGDLRVSPKIALWRVDGDDAPLDIAFIPTVTLPSASLLNDIILGAGDTRYMGESFFTLAPEVAVSRQIGQLRLAGNLGYRIRPPTTAVYIDVGSEAFYRAGVAYRFNELLAVPLELGTSLGGQATSFNPFAGINRNPLEWMAQVKYDVLPILQVHAGGGVGILAGYGTPDFRVFAGAQFVPPRDEVPPKPTHCDAGPEDIDGFEDDDHCIDPDNDNDGILDTADACPREPEDKDGSNDDDGCPDPDNDGDGILDTADKCPDDAEDPDGYEDSDGCPEPDNDNDDILDTNDKCPLIPEDRDGFQDEDGCPDPDNDGDGLLDANDKCPNEPETINGNEDEDGCPDQGKTKVVVTKEKIEILEKVFFDVNKATIQKRSFGLLDQVAAVLKNNKQLTKIRIEGHTDSDGSDASNLKLSQARTESVMKYLIDKGVEASRLEPVGYGETRPTVPNTTKANKEKNRRVEFAIVEVDGKPVEKTTEVKTPAP